MRRLALLVAVLGVLLTSCSSPGSLGDPGSCDPPKPDRSAISHERHAYLDQLLVPVWEAIMDAPLVEGMPSFGDAFAEVWVDPSDGVGVVVAAVKETTFTSEDRVRVESAVSDPASDLRIDFVAFSHDDLAAYAESVQSQAPPRDSLWTAINGRDGYVVVATDEAFEVTSVPDDALCWQFDDGVFGASAWRHSWLR